MRKSYDRQNQNVLYGPQFGVKVRNMREGQFSIMPVSRLNQLKKKW